MGPWLRSHGRPIQVVPGGISLLASMGPWLRSHGRSMLEPSEKRAIRLQWGRGFAATEGEYQGDDCWKVTMLQWGRGFAATEGTSMW